MARMETGPGEPRKNSIQPAIAELERMYQGLKPLFPGGIPGNDPVIVIQQSRSPSLGSLTPRAWESREGREVNEISIAAEHLARPVDEIMATLLHGMVHHVNASRGIRDCSPEGYHNRSFRELAMAVGLTVHRDGRHGWVATGLGPRAQRAVYGLNVNQHVFELFRKPQAVRKWSSKMLKWSCGCTTVRCATNLRARCEECGQPFERE